MDTVATRRNETRNASTTEHCQDEEVCGNRCHDPNALPPLTCYDQVLCAQGQLPCGRRCYDPQDEKCVEVEGYNWDNDFVFYNPSK